MYTIHAPDVCAAYAPNYLDNMPIQSEYVYYRKGKQSRRLRKTEGNTMTRFEREINGSLGDFWKRNAQEEVKKAVAQADEKATVEADGAIRWNSNGSYLMDDFCEKLEYAGYPFDREATAKKRDAQNEEFLAEYRRNDKGLSGEALAEARAAFGEGTVVVDVLTGRQTRL